MKDHRRRVAWLRQLVHLLVQVAAWAACATRSPGAILLAKAGPILLSALDLVILWVRRARREKRKRDSNDG
jgi:hypothetical protein